MEHVELALVEPPSARHRAGAWTRAASDVTTTTALSTCGEGVCATTTGRACRPRARSANPGGDHRQRIGARPVRNLAATPRRRPHNEAAGRNSWTERPASRDNGEHEHACWPNMDCAAQREGRLPLRRGSAADDRGQHRLDHSGPRDPPAQPPLLGRGRPPGRGTNLHRRVCRRGRGGLFEWGGRRRSTGEPRRTVFPGACGDRQRRRRGTRGSGGLCPATRTRPASS